MYSVHFNVVMTERNIMDLAIVLFVTLFTLAFMGMVFGQ